ncbi:hypothetical protein GHT89_16330 [Acinetobacter baumannii]|uniref:hypothetical protein n=1 Tax=Acinetobacter baumannii TaxID=470 RepID=UPI00387DD60D
MSFNFPTLDELNEQGFDNQFLKALSYVKNHIGNEEQTPIHFGAFIYFWERYLFAHADRLSENYKGGTWKLENGFWCLESNDQFDVFASHGEKYTVNALEFSIIANLFALSHMAINTYQQKGNEFINTLSVNFSDYIKLLLDRSLEKLNNEAIFMVTD